METNLKNLNSTLSVKMPGNFIVEIREQNGEDDDVISNIATSQDGSALCNFIAGIIVSNSKHPDSPTTPEEVMSWPIRNKYWLLLHSRIFSLGADMVFEHTFADGVKQKFEEDLTIFTKPYENEFISPGVKNPLYKDYLCKPYDLGESLEITLSSGKTVSYEYLSGYSEKRLLEMDRDNISKNDELRVRNLKLKTPQGNFLPLLNFKEFTAREMSELRTVIYKADPEFKIETEITHPKTKEKETVSLITYLDFFFPLGLGAN